MYSVAVDTLFLCLLEDLETNDGSVARFILDYQIKKSSNLFVSRPYFMSKELSKIVTKSSSSSGNRRQIFVVSDENRP